MIPLPFLKAPHRHTSLEGGREGGREGESERWYATNQVILQQIDQTATLDSTPRLNSADCHGECSQITNPNWLPGGMISYFMDHQVMNTREWVRVLSGESLPQSKDYSHTYMYIHT